MRRFDNRTVIVTGGARGMGASHARGFVAEGGRDDGLPQQRRVPGQQVGNAGIDQDGGAGARARQHPRQLHPPRPRPQPMTAGPDAAAAVAAEAWHLAIPRVAEPDEITPCGDRSHRSRRIWLGGSPRPTRAEPVTCRR